MTCSSSATATSTARKGTNTVNLRMHSLAIILFVCCITLAAAFSPPACSMLPSTSSRPQSNNIRTTSSPQRTRARTALQNFKDDDDDDEDKDLENYDANTAAQIRKARKLLRDAKKKMEETTKQQQQQQQSNGENNVDTSSSPLPFFAQQSFTATAIDHTQKIKSKTKTGIIADGETMTSLSNSEPWERRSLSDIGFESEAREDYDGNEVQVDLNGDVLGGQTLAERDLAASIYNLRKVLQNEDFRSVFDSRNRFIGEVD